MRQLSLKYPLIVAPMAGGPSSADLVAEASNAGALGSVGAAYSSPDLIRKFIKEVRVKTNKPFAVNLFIPSQISPPPQEWLAKAIAATRKYRQELELPDPQLVPPYEENFDEQFAEVIHHKPAALSFVFGLLGKSYINEAKRRGISLIGTATTLEEAEALEASGVDAVTLQGVEAGGHRGIFDANAPDPGITAFDLLKQCVGKVKTPLIAAGGIMTSNDIRTALSLGATAVQMGTAFLVCQEAGTSAPYRRALLNSDERLTQTTRTFSGRLARGLKNRFMLELEKRGPEVILPFPAQNKFTRDLRNASVQRNSSDFISLWAGAGKGDLWTGPANELIEKLFGDIDIS